MDHTGGVFTWLHMRDIDIPSRVLRTLSIPSRASAWRTEVMVARRAYSAEFTRWMMFPATTVSFSIRSPSLENDTSSPAREASSLFRIGEKGGSLPNAPIARSRQFGTRSGYTGAEVVSTIENLPRLSAEFGEDYRIKIFFYLQRSAGVGFSRYLSWQFAQAVVITSEASRILS